MFRRKTYKAKKRVLIEGLEPRQLLAGDGLSATYFHNADLTGPAFQRVDQGIDFHWGADAPDPSLSADAYSVRWTGKLIAPTTENYTFYLAGADGTRGYASNILFINDWQVRSSPHENVLSSPVVAGQKYSLKVEFFSTSKNADVQLMWSSPSTPKQIIPKEYLYSSTPVITSGPTASPNIVTGNSTNLSVLATDDKPEANLTYTWSVIDKPNGASDPTFNINGTNDSKNTTATFTRAGNYTFRVSVADPGGRRAVADVNVKVTPAQLGLKINVGGTAAGSFGDDFNFSGGTATAANDTIDMSGVANPAPQSVYQSYRYGDFTYNASDLTPGKLYSIRLHFSENYWTDRGQRVFDVKINDITRLDHYDIFNQAQARLKAVTEQFNAVADASGNIKLQFISDVDNAVVNGIEIAPVTNFVYVKDFGAIGDGIIDDATEVQAAIDAAPDNSTLVFEAGKTYKLNTGMVIHKPLNFEGNGATLKLNTSAYPHAEMLFFESPLAADAYTWTAKPSVGQNAFNVSIPTNKIAAGDTVFLQLGQDPYDHNEENYTAIAKVISNDGTTITLDKSAPYDINMGAFPNRITKITNLVSNVYVHNFVMDYYEGQVPDTQVWTNIVKNFTMDDITGRFTILLNAAESEGVSLNDVNGELKDLHSAAGRVFTAWHGNHMNITNVHATTSTDSTTFLLESWTHNVYVNNYTIDWNFTANPSSAVFHLTGGSYGNFFDNVKINNVGGIKLALSGVQPSQFHFGNVTVSGLVIYAPLAFIDNFHADGHDYLTADAVTDTFTVDVLPNKPDLAYVLANGVIKSYTATISTKTGVQAVFVSNSKGSGVQILGQLKANQAVVFNQSYGTDYPNNTPDVPLKIIHLMTGAVPAGATLTITVTYYPAA